MMKKFLKYLGFGLLSVFLCFIGIITITTIFKPDHKEVFEPFIQEAIPRLASWDIQEYQSIMSTEGYQSATEEQWHHILQMFAKLGTYQQCLEPELLSTKTFINTKSGIITHAVYQVPILFDTGLAHVKLSLLYDDGEVKAHGIKYLSDLLQ